MPGKAGSRANGEGTLYRRGEGWAGAISLGNGKRKTVYGNTKAEVNVKLDGARAKVGMGMDITAKDPRMVEWINQWLDAKESSGAVRPTTVRNYRDVANTYVIPHIGAIKLSKLRAHHVEQMLATLSAEGKSANTRRLARTVLAMSLREAKKRRMVVFNEAEDVDGPSITGSYEGRTLSPREALSLLDGTEGTELGPFVALGILGGLRPGESCALRWTDVDFEHRTIKVAATLTNNDGWERTAPKTKKSLRTFMANEMLLDALEEHKCRQALWQHRHGTRWQDLEFVVTYADGGPIPPPTATKMLRRQSAEVLEGSSWKGHELRHTHASISLAWGESLREIADRLGHASIVITSDTYAHLSPGELQSRSTGGIVAALTRAAKERSEPS